jgi:hypothetical protein
VTNSQIDRLGEILRSGERGADALRMLDELYDVYEPVARRASTIVRSVIDAYGSVVDEYGSREVDVLSTPH